MLQRYLEELRSAQPRTGSPPAALHWTEYLDKQLQHLVTQLKFDFSLIGEKM